MAHANVKCDCGHTAKHHYRGGWCSGKHTDNDGKREFICGCTWYWPNVKYQEKIKKSKKTVY